MEGIVPNEAANEISITLNRFLHRIDCKATMIELVTQHGCSLTRIRRSKNWLLMGTQAQLVELSAKLHEGKTLWIAEAIDKTQPKATINLSLIINANPEITVNQLIAETGCTLIEARAAMDHAEGFN